jgi:F0F1-type ATP synthase membrane subunit b/b'
MDIYLILVLLNLVLFIFVIKLSIDIKKGFDSIKSRQDYIENKIDEIKR